MYVIACLFSETSSACWHFEVYFNLSLCRSGGCMWTHVWTRYIISINTFLLYFSFGKINFVDNFCFRMSGAYSVVEFPRGGISVMPTSWLDGAESSCWWPSALRGPGLRNAIKKRQPPQPDWEKHPFVNLLCQSGEFPPAWYILNFDLIRQVLVYHRHATINACELKFNDRSYSGIRTSTDQLSSRSWPVSSVC